MIGKGKTDAVMWDAAKKQVLNASLAINQASGIRHPSSRIIKKS
jgi:hypothetical protein